MAAKELSTPAAEPVSAPFGMPRLDVPDVLTLDDSGYVNFTLETERGAVHVRTYWTTWECRGTVAALVAGGLMRAEWSPGLPGNNKTRQSVFFDANGPHLLVGRRGGPKYEGAHIVIARCSARTFAVEIPVSAEHIKRLESLQAQRKARWEAEREKRRRAEYEKESEARRRARRESETQDDVKGELTQLVVSVGRLLACRLEDSRFRYADEVMTEVNQHLEAAKHALLVHTLKPVLPKYPCDGNVIYLQPD